MLKLIKNTPDFYTELERKAAMLEKGIYHNLEITGVKGLINRVGSMMTFFFTDEKQITSYDEAMKSDSEKYARFFKMSLESGIYLAPSQYECCFVSYAHTDKDIETIIAANLDALKKL
jgi:glutamate-1-semialdehyde 2,1-aminomutase